MKKIFIIGVLSLFIIGLLNCQKKGEEIPPTPCHVGKWLSMNPCTEYRNDTLKYTQLELKADGTGSLSWLACVSVPGTQPFKYTFTYVLKDTLIDSRTQSRIKLSLIQKTLNNKVVLPNYYETNSFDSWHAIQCSTSSRDGNDYLSIIDIWYEDEFNFYLKKIKNTSIK